MVTSLSQSPKCPVCPQQGKTVAEDLNLTPFCSARCKRIDLAKWLLEGYSLETDTFDYWEEGLTQGPN